jgi:hypothetical protein
MADKTGSCLCGAVAFEITGPLRSVIACHCHQCRKQTGTYMSSTAVKDERLERLGMHMLRITREKRPAPTKVDRQAGGGGVVGAAKAAVFSAAYLAWSWGVAQLYMLLEH